MRHSLLVMILLLISLSILAVLVTACSAAEALPPPTETPEPGTAAIAVVEPTATPIPTKAPEASAETPTATPMPTEPPPTPTEPPPPTPTEPPAPSPAEQSGGGSDMVDLDAIFPPGPGRDLSLMGCTGCHNFVPLVIVQFTPEEWDRNARDHRDRVAAMTDANYKTLYEYLKENFGPDDPVPEIPQVLLDQWTSY